jgi:hypothetical protein
VDQLRAALSLPSLQTAEDEEFKIKFNICRSTLALSFRKEFPVSIDFLSVRTCNFIMYAA